MIGLRFTDEMMRNPLNIIPPDQRLRVALRFGDSRGLLVNAGRTLDER